MYLLQQKPTAVFLRQTCSSLRCTRKSNTCSAFLRISASHSSSEPLRQVARYSAGFVATLSLVFGQPALADDKVSTLVALETEAGPVTTSRKQSKQIFFDISVDGEPYGRIVVELYDDVPVGSLRFSQLAEGLDGAGYRRSRFDAITPEYMRNGGVKQLTYKDSNRTELAGGDDTFQLESELEGQQRSHSTAGVVSLVVRSAEERPVKEKLVAYQGKFVTVQESQGEVPNGSAFTITLGPAPQLDGTNLVVGRVVDGADVMDKLAQLPVVKDNRGSPFFKAGKAFGDKRADVAERGFGRPFAKVLVSESGILGAPSLN